MDGSTRLFWGVLALLLVMSAYFALGADRKRRALEGGPSVTAEAAR